MIQSNNPTDMTTTAAVPCPTTKQFFNGMWIYKRKSTLISITNYNAVETVHYFHDGDMSGSGLFLVHQVQFGCQLLFFKGKYASLLSCKFRWEGWYGNLMGHLTPPLPESSSSHGKASVFTPQQKGILQMKIMSMILLTLSWDAPCLLTCQPAMHD